MRERWRLAVNRKTGERTLRNFKVQSAGADVLRLANVLLHENGIQVCCPVHDAFLVECAESDLEDVEHAVRHQMERASELVLEGFRLRVEVKPLRYPDRLQESRGQVMWDRVTSIVARLNRAA